VIRATSTEKNKHFQNQGDLLTTQTLRGLSACCYRPGVTNMPPAKEFRAARDAFRRDQQSWTNRFHSI